MVKCLVGTLLGKFLLQLLGNYWVCFCRSGYILLMCYVYHHLEKQLKWKVSVGIGHLFITGLKLILILVSAQYLLDNCAVDQHIELHRGAHGLSSSAWWYVLIEDIVHYNHFINIQIISVYFSAYFWNCCFKLRIKVEHLKVDHYAQLLTRHVSNKYI